MNAGRRRRSKLPAPPNADAPTVREFLAASSRDLGYLAVKEQLGEPLSASERALLEANRAAQRHPAGKGGGE
jgi:hypothetical protein